MWTATAGSYLQAGIRRLACRACERVRTKTVPWARPSARFTHDFEAVVGYLAQRTDKTTITRLLRCEPRRSQGASGLQYSGLSIGRVPVS
jgi:hypothetical protein